MGKARNPCGWTMEVLADLAERGYPSQEINPDAMMIMFTRGYTTLQASTKLINLRVNKKFPTDRNIPSLIGVTGHEPPAMCSKCGAPLTSSPAIEHLPTGDD